MSDPKPRNDGVARDEPVVDTELTAEEVAALEEGWADYLAGRVYSHAEVVAWLRTWGTDDETPGPHR
jgi:predicted transcriptional regulator